MIHSLIKTSLATHALEILTFIAGKMFYTSIPINQNKFAAKIFSNVRSISIKTGLFFA
jgi:hypothetical protein